MKYSSLLKYLGFLGIILFGFFLFAFYNKLSNLNNKIEDYRKTFSKSIETLSENLSTATMLVKEILNKAKHEILSAQQRQIMLQSSSVELAQVLKMQKESNERAKKIGEGIISQLQDTQSKFGLQDANTKTSLDHLKQTVENTTNNFDSNFRGQLYGNQLVEEYNQNKNLLSADTLTIKYLDTMEIDLGVIGNMIEKKSFENFGNNMLEEDKKNIDQLNQIFVDNKDYKSLQTLILKIDSQKTEVYQINDSMNKNFNNYNSILNDNIFGKTIKIFGLMDDNFMQ